MHFPKRFTKSERLLRPADFQRVLKLGKKIQTRSFKIALVPNTAGKNRLGVSVSARVANSVGRSRLKRLIREFFRLNKGAIKAAIAGDGVVKGQGVIRGEGAARGNGAPGGQGVFGGPGAEEGAERVGNLGGVKGAHKTHPTFDIVISVKRADLIRGLREVESELRPVLLSARGHDKGRSTGQ